MPVFSAKTSAIDGGPIVIDMPRAVIFSIASGGRLAASITHRSPMRRHVWSVVGGAAVRAVVVTHVVPTWDRK